MNEDLIRMNQQRADCYRLLSACFCTPSKEFIEEGLMDNLLTSLKPVCPDALPYAQEVSDALSRFDLKKDILVDYSRLFIGPFKLIAPPYGSVYLEPERRLMGDTTVDVVRIYQKAGVEMDRDTHKDMPDHISVEMEFIYYLLMKEVDALMNGDKESAKRYEDLRKDFLKRHLGAWAFKFLKDMKEGAKNPFYKNLAECTEVFLKHEMEWESAIEV